MRSIGRYVILGLLGRGGMGAVYKAAMPCTGRVAALKLLRPSEDLAAAADFDALRRGFYREAQLMASIRHPGVAQVLDVDEDASGCPFFVMEYYCNNLGAQLGESYRVEEPTRRLGVEQSLSVGRQLAGALARLHHEGILHRDVKPYNLMLADRPVDFAPEGLLAGQCYGDEVKLIDFGLSRLRGEVEAGRPRGAVVGSPYYAAPEQEADPASADERADVFSAGVTLFRCLTGRLPQEGAPASALRQGLDARFDAFFARCCHEDRAKRPASARALLTELDELAAHWRKLQAAACALPHDASEVEPVAPCVDGALRAEPQRQGLAGALAYAERLNAEEFAGRTGWRLPTVDELSTLLLPEPDLRQLCLAGAFAQAQRRLWSADRKSFMAAWYADAEHGFVWWQDVTCEFFARCVTSGR